MNKNVKDENGEKFDKAPKDTSFANANTHASATMRSEEDNNGIDHRIVLFGWRLRLASGKNIFTECSIIVIIHSLKGKSLLYYK